MYLINTFKMLNNHAGKLGPKEGEASEQVMLIELEKKIVTKNSTKV